MRYRFLASPAEELRMDEQRVRKTCKCQLMPTPEQARALATVVWRCRELYNAGLQERKAAWERCRVSVTFAMQSAQLPAIKKVRPEYHDINAQVLQDVLHRLDKACAAFFRRVQAGARPGYPRFQGRDRYNSLPIHRSARTVVQCWTAGCSASPRLGDSAFGCTVHSKASPRR
jgi:putative transposase